MDKRTAIFVVASIVIFSAMLGIIGVDKVWNALKMANMMLIGLAIALQIITFLLYNLRWNMLNKTANINISFKTLLPITMVGFAINNITPSGRGGGEPVRAYILAKEHGYKIKETFATVVADRVLDTFPFIVLTVITIFTLSFSPNIPDWLIVIMIIAAIAIILILIILVYMCINLNFGNRIEKFIFRLTNRFKKDSEHLEETIHENINGFQNTMNLLISNKKVLYTTIPLSFLIWIVEISRVYFVFLAFGAVTSFSLIGEVFIVASLIGMIPLLPGGLGAVDGTMIYLYSTSGISTAITAPVTVVERMISFWMATIIGLVILPHYGSSILERISPKASTEELEKSLKNESDNQ
ncbi:UPF0104 family protein [uncultured Methanobrevibacter sp.]|uniref:UPF0104 family protein n=1 Tax=uncultured Methanobrevibacter sp. TaxID=253161 RepID=UPI0025CE8D02|nr:UPF0104 family protein [uncultured Methanobrevibacter sp.]